MISDERKEELQFLIRTRTPIRMTDDIAVTTYLEKVPFTDISLDYSDMFTLRDLYEAGIVTFDGLVTSPGGGQSLTTTFYEDINITNDDGDLMHIREMEVINIAVESAMVEDLQHYIGN